MAHSQAPTVPDVPPLSPASNNDLIQEELKLLYNTGFNPALQSKSKTSLYVTYVFDVYKRQAWSGSTLAIQFAEDFEDFKQEDFNNCDKETLINLRKHMRRNGVYVSMKRFEPVAKALADAIKDELPWPELDKDRPNNLPLHTSITPPKNEPSSSNVNPTIESKYVNNYHSQQHDPFFPRPVQQNFRSSYTPNQQNPSLLHGTNYIDQSPNTLPNPEEMISKTYNSNTHQGFSRELMSLNKMYSEENKYSGLPTESFTYKFSIFIDLASKSEIPQDALPTAFSTMLKGMALEYYYSCCQGSTLTISQLIKRFQEHFEGEEHRRNMLREWNKINLRDMFHKNPSKEKGFVFNEMVQILRATQRGLDQEYQTDSALRNKIISACSNIPACSSAILQQTHSISALCNNIYAALEYNETAIRAESSDPALILEIDDYSSRC
ncbi:putative glycosyl transferase [Erysiphe neolycopersici]|uniref:Putative glycosyl transferase n=1 Tax=Erysiphe neolycopersici TaxID=212602 RepID=A0A420I3S0_9PEZI|nr:putative glycosyl transferase [Erysiphe neolycopersici]